MADIIDYKIFGDDLQLVEIELDPGEGVRAEAGTMTYMEDGIQMQTGTGGGIFKGLQRAFTGESFFITTFLNSGSGKQKVAFAAPYPGKIIPLCTRRFQRRHDLPEGFLLMRGSGHRNRGRLHQTAGSRHFRRGRLHPSAA